MTKETTTTQTTDYFSLLTRNVCLKEGFLHQDGRALALHIQPLRSGIGAKKLALTVLDENRQVACIDFTLNTFDKKTYLNFSHRYEGVICDEIRSFSNGGCIFVKPELQKTGIGTLLFGKVIDISQAVGINEIVIKNPPSETRAFYETMSRVRGGRSVGRNIYIDVGKVNGK